MVFRIFFRNDGTHSSGTESQHRLDLARKSHWQVFKPPSEFQCDVNEEVTLRDWHSPPCCQLLTCWAPTHRMPLICMQC